MVERDGARPKSTDDVKSDLSEGLKSCSEVLASYRSVFENDRGPFTKGWKH